MKDLTLWKPIDGLPAKLYLEQLSDNYDGLHLILHDENHEKKIRITFDEHIGYRNFNESERLVLINALPSFTQNWTLFEAKNTSFSNWLSDQSYNIIDVDTIIHYIIGTPEDIVDVLAFEPPLVEWITDTD